MTAIPKNAELKGLQVLKQYGYTSAEEVFYLAQRSAPNCRSWSVLRRWKFRTSSRQLWPCFLKPRSMSSQVSNCRWGCRWTKLRRPRCLMSLRQSKRRMSQT